jgi:hypothetical protein
MRRTLTSALDAPVDPPGNGVPGPAGAVPGRVQRMIRHVVIFTWSDAADERRRATSVQALRRLRQDVGGMQSLIVAEDAGLSDGNGDVVLIADFPDAEAFYRYAQDPVHLAVVAEHVRPWISARSALQYHF